MLPIAEVSGTGGAGTSGLMHTTDPFDPAFRIALLGGMHQPVLLAAGALGTSTLILLAFGLGSLLVALGVLGFAGLSLYTLARMEVELHERRSRRTLADHAQDLVARRRRRSELASRRVHPTAGRPEAHGGADDGEPEPIAA